MLPALDLRDRHVVITGGGGGLGVSVVEAFASAGATCHLPVRESVGNNPSDSAAGAVRRTGGVDLTDQAAVTAFYAGLPPLFASVHLAGGYRGAGILETTRQVLEQQLMLNLLTAFLCCREAVRAMRNNGHGQGRIVNVGSRASELPGAGAVAYTIAKAGVAALTRALAAEVRDDGILVNAVLPSIIDTPANRAAMPKANHARWPKPEELAAAILWLASPANQLTTGALLPVYGNG